jgi:ABC-2 type transport system permease protein
MNSTLAAPAVLAPTSTGASRPTFLGILRGELFKISRQRATWVMGGMMVLLIALPYLVILNSPLVKNSLLHDPLNALYGGMGTELMFLRVFSGLFLILLTARLIGMEYSSGTIRVLLARGVGRLQLLFAKLLAIAVIALGTLIGGILLNAVLSVLAVGAVTGSLDAFKAANDGFWADSRSVVLTVAISMAVSILLAAALTVLTRSLAGGLSLGLSWFPVDNLGILFFFLGYRLTQSDAWQLVTGDLLGPNLNAMAGAVLPPRAALAIEASNTIPPLVPVSGAHTLLIAAIYTVIFAAVAIGFTGWRDVTE